jgi:hypothetical protein
MANFDRPIPKMGDGRFSNYHFKKQLDIIRCLHYEMFGRDLSVSGQSGGFTRGNHIPRGNEVFIRGNNIHREKGISTYIRGVENFSITFATGESNYIGLDCDAEVFKKPNATLFAVYIEECFKRLIGERYNLISRYLHSTAIGIDYVPFDYYGNSFEYHEDKEKFVEGNNLYKLLKDWDDHALVELLYVDKESLTKKGLPEDHIEIIMTLIKSLQDDNYELKQQMINNDLYKNISPEIIYYNTSELKKVLKIN